MRSRILLKISAVVSGISGVVILTAVLVPIVFYETPTLISPLAEEPQAGGEEIDYTKASNWFVGGAEEEEFISAEVNYYTLSIKKLGIEDATVALGGEDLSQSLIQYPGTALPGKIGNAVVFGHSILPIFYNPKDYIAIFSTLPTLKKGDEIAVNYDGVSYKYRVETLFEVLPTDIEVLEQDTSDSFLTLVTCVPPGDPRKPKRLIVRARIVPPEISNENTRH
ncbi:MAG: sortase [Patescibacteria group bacterium]